MIPDEVSYKGLTLDPRDILSPRKLIHTVVPIGWVRHQFPLEFQFDAASRLDRWLEANIVGRWALYAETSRGNGMTFVLYFELVSDAIMFRMKGGETAWLETPPL